MGKIALKEVKNAAPDIRKLHAAFETPMPTHRIPPHSGKGAWGFVNLPAETDTDEDTDQSEPAGRPLTLYPSGPDLGRSVPEVARA